MPQRISMIHFDSGGSLNGTYHFFTFEEDTLLVGKARESIKFSHIQKASPNRQCTRLCVRVDFDSIKDHQGKFIKKYQKIFKKQYEFLHVVDLQLSSQEHLRRPTSTTHPFPAFQDTGAATTGGATWRITGTGRSRTGRGATGATGTGAGAGTGTGTGTGTSATCFANPRWNELTVAVRPTVIFVTVFL